MTVLEELARLEDVTLVVHPDAMSPYLADEARWVMPGRPLAIALAASTAGVQAIMRLATVYQVAVVPRGAGTGLSGGATAIDGCVVLSLERMNLIR